MNLLRTILTGRLGEKIISYKLLLGSVSILIMVAMLYAPVAHYDFINYDDNAYIHNDPIVSQGLTGESLNHAFRSFSNPYFMPLTRLSFMLDVTLFGTTNPGAFHITNAVLHALNSVLIFLLIFKISSRFFAAWFIAGLFALHPQHIEAVAWVAERKEMLAAFFGLLSLMSYQQFVISAKRSWFLFSLIFYGLCLFSKPIWVTLPALLLIWDYFPLNRLSVNTLKSCLIEKLPFLIVGSIFSLIFLMSLQLDEPASYFLAPDWNIRWALPFVGLGDYLTNTLIPLNLFPFYPYPEQIHISVIVFWLGFFSALSWLLFLLHRTYPGLLMAFSWFLIALLPAFTLILSPKGEALFSSDRYSYLPHIGLFTGLVLSIFHSLDQQKPFIKQVSLGIMLVLLLSNFFLARTTLSNWTNSETLWLHTIKHIDGRGKSYVLGLLGSHYMDEKRIDEALDIFKQGHAIDPHSFIHPFFISSLLKQYHADDDEANMWQDKLLNESPAPANLLFNLGKADYMNGNYLRAVLFLEKALEKRSQSPVLISLQELHTTIGISQALIGNMKSALEHLKKIHWSVEDRIGICKFLAKKIPYDDKTRNKDSRHIEVQSFMQQFCVFN